MTLGSSGNVTISLNTQYTIKHIQGQFYLDGTLKSSLSTTNTLQTGTRTIYLFAMNNITEVQLRNSQAEIHYCKIWYGSNLMMDVIPVLKDNVPCMFDKVTYRYFYNAGTGTFLYG